MTTCVTFFNIAVAVYENPLPGQVSINPAKRVESGCLKNISNYFIPLP
jgi:hypothetical protein